MLRAAAAEPDWLVVGVDTDLAGLGAAFSRAQRQRLVNAMFVLASAEAPPKELFEVADEVRVQFPWGSLLKGILDADPAVAANLASLVKPGGRLVVSLSVTERDHLPGISDLDQATAATIGRRFATASGLLAFRRAAPITRAEADALHSTWAKRLGVSRTRSAWTFAFARVPEARARSRRLPAHRH